MAMNSTSIGLLAVSIVFPVLSIIFVTLRFAARRVRSAPKVDDWVCLAAVFFCVGLGINTTVGAARGVFGEPAAVLGLKKTTVLLKIIYADSFITFAALAVIKISVLLFYKRIFITSKFRNIVYVLIAVIVAWWLASFFALLFSQRPISTHWNPRAKVIHLNINFKAFLLTHASLDLFFDILILTLPLPAIIALKMSLTRKIGVICILWLGSFCVIAEAVRIYYFHRFLYQDLTSHAGAFGSVVSDVLIWSRIEPCCSVIAACLPALGPLIRDGRTPQSIIASVRSTFSLHSGRGSSEGTGNGNKSTGNSGSREGSSRDGELARAEWIQLNQTGTTTTRGCSN